MKRWVTRLLGLVWFAVMPLAQADSAADQLQRLLNSFSTFQANFSQQTLQTNGRVIQQGTGLVKIKRPGKFYWITKQPTEQHLISDGKKLWIYDVDLAQATSQALASRTSIDPAALLSGGVSKLTTQFNIREQHATATQTFTLTPLHPDSAGFASMTLSFRQKQLVAMTVLNNLSQQSEFSFTNIILNQPLAESWFNFKPPKGVDVVEQ